MRLLFAIAVFTAFASVGCKSNPHKEDGQPEAAKAAAATPAKDAKAEAAKATPASDMKMECDKKSDKRMLEVRPKEKGCELAYTKNGQEAVVASSQYSNAHCKATMEKIKGNLEKAGFTCK
jgi:hypothetical protein